MASRISCCHLNIITQAWAPAAQASGSINPKVLLYSPNSLLHRFNEKRCKEVKDKPCDLMYNRQEMQEW